MKCCCVPGCSSILNETKKCRKNREKIKFFHIPRVSKTSTTVAATRNRRQAWLKAINVREFPDAVLNNFTVCSKHFISGQPASERYFKDVDWIPSQNLPKNNFRQNKDESFTNRKCWARKKKSKLSSVVRSIIEKLPHVLTKYDCPEYILIDKTKFNVKQIENNILEKYIMAPRSIRNVEPLHHNDHDYLGTPETDIRLPNLLFDHNYFLTTQPACQYFDSRYFCNICQIDCENLFFFNNHMDKHTVQNVIFCRLCCATFLTSACLNKHIARHVELCRSCGNEVPRVQLGTHQLLNKMQKIDLYYDWRDDSSQEEKIYFCIFCLKKFSNKYVFSKHKNNHKKILDK